MNLASDVPPVVDSLGVTPSSCFTALEIKSDNSPGGVIKLSPDILKSVLNLIPYSADTFSISSFSQETREEPEWLSLNLIFIVALVTAGITFDALLPVSTEVIAKVDGSKCSVPASS